MSAAAAAVSAAAKAAAMSTATAKAASMSATAAVSCLRFPSVYEPPTLAEITQLINSRPD